MCTLGLIVHKRLSLSIAVNEKNELPEVARVRRKRRSQQNPKRQKL